MTPRLFLVPLCVLSIVGGRPADPQAMLTVPVQAIEVSDDDGGRPPRVTPAQVKTWIDFSNRTFAPAGVRFEFRPDRRDYASIRSTLLNNVMGTQDADWGKAKAAGNRVAARYPGKLVVLLRHGPGEQAAGNGFSWHDYNFVVMSGWDDMRHCGHPHEDALAHEVGHFLGLSHTFVGDPLPTVRDAEAALRKKGNDPAAFDGDGFSDTPPDPGIRPQECGQMPRVVLNGVSFVLPRDNIMSYYNERTRLSPEQVRRVRWLLQKRQKGEMAMPVNTGARTPIEFETLLVLRKQRCEPSVQRMEAWGDEGWSAGAHWFCGARQGGSATVGLEMRRAGRYRLDLYATQAPDFGTVQVALDDRKLGAPVDLYAPVVMPSGRISLGTVDVSKGVHELRFDVTGKHAESGGFRFGLDCVDLVPTGP